MKRVVVSSVVTLLIILLVGLGYYYYNKSSIFQSNPIEAVPPDAAFVFKTKNAGKSFQRLFQNESWRFAFQVANETKTKEALVFIDSLFGNSKETELNNAWNQQELVVSLHITKASNFDFLFFMNTSSVFSERKIINFFEEMSVNSIRQRRYDDVMIREMDMATGSFTFAFVNGVMICSSTSFLVEDAVRQAKTGTSIAKNASFKRVSASLTEGELTCYVNSSGIGNIIANYGSSNADDIIHFINNMSSWTAVDMNIQSHSFFMNGFSSFNDSTQLVALFKEQVPVKSEISEVVPGRSAMVLSYCFSNPVSFFRTAMQNNAFAGDFGDRINALGNLRRKYKIDFGKELTSLASNSITLVITESGNVNFGNNCFLAIETSQSDKARKTLERLRTQVNSINQSPDRTEKYRDHIIGFLNVNGLPSLIFGKSFTRISKFYYTQIRNYVVVGNSASALRGFIDDYKDQKTLVYEKEVKQSIQSFSNSTNLLLYMNFPLMKNILRAYTNLPGPFSDSKQSMLGMFSTFIVSLKNEQTGMSVSALLDYLPEATTGINLVASAQLDTSIAMKPCVFSYGRLKENRIALQDMLNQLYLLDEAGEVIWKRTFEEQVLGEIYAVDYFKNGEKQLFFITPSAMHLIDMSGQYVGNYPIKIPSKTTTGGILIKDDLAQQSRVFVYCVNGLIYAYELSGKPVSNWFQSISVADINTPLLYLKSKESNLLVLYKLNREIRCFDMTGNEVSLWPNQQGSMMRDLKLFSDSLGNSFLSTIDSGGHIIKLYSNKNVERKLIRTSPQFIDYCLTSRNHSGVSYYYCTIDSLIGCDQNNQLLQGYPVANLPIAFFQSVTTGAGREIIFLNTGMNKIYVVEDSGPLNVKAVSIKGTTQIGVSDSMSDKIIIVTADSEGMLYYYELK